MDGDPVDGLYSGPSSSSSDATSVLIEPLYEESNPSYDGRGILFLLPELESFLLESGSLDLYFSPARLALSYSISEHVKLSFPLSSVVVELWCVAGTGEWWR